MGTTRTATTALIGLVAVGIVAACTDSGEDTTKKTSGSQTTIEMTEVKGTDTLRPKTRVIGDWDTVISGNRSTVITEIAGSDGKATQIYAIDPSSRKQTPLEVTSPVSMSTAGNARTAVVAGDRLKDNRRQPYLRVSNDLKSWRAQDLTLPNPGWKVSSVAVDGKVPLVIATSPKGEAGVMRVDGTSSPPRLLPAAEAQEVNVIDIVEHGGALVMLFNEGARGDESLARVMTSTDGGTSWQRGAALPGARGAYGVTGMVSTGKHLIVTGWADRTAPQGTSGMVWTSADGDQWTRERPEAISWSHPELAQTEDFHLTAPSLVNGRALFDQTCGTCTWTTRFTHSGSGEPKRRDSRRDINGASPDVDQLAGYLPEGVRWEQGSLVSFGLKGSEELLAGDHPMSLESLDRLDSTTLASVGRYRFSGSESDGWSTTTDLTPFVLEGTLKRQSWTPKVLSSWSEVHTATDRESGVDVAAGTLHGHGGFSADTRAQVDGSWKSPAGLGRYGYETVDGVFALHGTFYLSLATAKDGRYGTTRQARIYSSRDGQKWSEDRGAWSRGKAGSSVSDVCALPDGSIFAVGSSQKDTNSRSKATTWTRYQGKWSMDVPRVKGKGAEFHSCATTGNSTVVSGSLAGDDVEWRTKTGRKFTPGKALPRNVSRAAPEQVKGGLVAAGYIDTKDHTGPIVWFSTDATSWQWAPVNVKGAGGVSVMTAGKEVYAATHQDSGDRLWKVDELATKKVTGNEG